MKTVFLSGSRGISSLDEKVRLVLDKLMRRGERFVIGDCGGADQLMQLYLHSEAYKDVVVYHVGRWRHNVGLWPSNRVYASADDTGRVMFGRKDKAMAVEADAAFVVWDGNSRGSLGNINEMRRLGKPVLVYNAVNMGFEKFMTEA